MTTQTETIKMLRELRMIFVAITDVPVTEDGEVVGYLVNNRQMNRVDELTNILAVTQEPQEAPELVEYRGYAHLGTGQYILNHSACGEPAELIISVASQDEKAGRVVGDERDNPPDSLILPEDMCVRLRFENVAGLDALEKQLRYLREAHFNTHPSKEAADTAMSGEFWLQHDDELRYVKRVLESGRDMTEADRIAALEMIHSLRTIIRAAPQAAPAVPSEPAAPIRHPTIEECHEAGVGPRNEYRKPYTDGGLPNTPEERERFKAYMRGHCWNIGQYDEERKCFDTVLVRQLYGVWRDRGALVFKMSGTYA